MNKLWEQYERIIKNSGAIVLTAQTPFDKILGCSNLKLLRYEWIWQKNKSTGFLNAKKMPMKSHENILVFYKQLPTYNPQKTEGHEPAHSFTKNTSDGSNYGKTLLGIKGGGQTDRYPKDVISVAVENNGTANKFHSTQKPVALFEYLVKTYTNEGDTVLDNCAGSGTTAIACLNTKRNFVLIEKEEKYYNIINDRINKHCGKTI